MMNAELTAENRPAFPSLISVSSTKGGNRTTHEDEGRVQVFVILFRVVPVKLSRFPAIHSEEVGTRVIGSQRVEEFFEGGMETGTGCQ